MGPARACSHERFLEGEAEACQQGPALGADIAAGFALVSLAVGDQGRHVEAGAEDIAAGDGDRVDVGMKSGLLENLSTVELRFVLGHELGHVLYEHSSLPVTEMLVDSGNLQAEEAVLLLGWSRASEISADRIGLLCAGSLTAAVTALFKTASGLKGIDSDTILRSFRKQYDELQAHQQERGCMFGWARTHPLMTVRFKALEMAALDVVALRNNATGFSWNSFHALDRQIAQTLSSLENRSRPSRGMHTAAVAALRPYGAAGWLDVRCGHAGYRRVSAIGDFRNT